MFGLILFILVLSFIGRLFTRPYYGYYRPRIYPYGGFGGWGMPYGPMHRRVPHHPMHHCGPHHHHMGHGRRW